MAKTEVYSWRVSPETKMALEQEARRRGTTVGALLDRLAQEWLRTNREADEVLQARLHAAAESTLGAIAGGDPRRAERARATIRAKLARRHGR